MHPLFIQRVHCIKIGVLAKTNHLQWKRWQCRRSLFNLNTIHQNTYYKVASLSTNAQKSPSFHSSNHRYSFHSMPLASSPIVCYTILEISISQDQKHTVILISKVQFLHFRDSRYHLSDLFPLTLNKR